MISHLQMLLVQLVHHVHQTLERVFAHLGVAVRQTIVVVEMEENVFPMVGPGATNSALVMDPDLIPSEEAHQLGAFETTHAGAVKS